MFCITLKHHFWKPEVEVILSVIVSFVMYVMYIDVGIEATACAHSVDTIRYEIISCLFTTETEVPDNTNSMDKLQINKSRICLPSGCHDY